MRSLQSPDRLRRPLPKALIAMKLFVSDRSLASIRECFSSLSAKQSVLKVENTIYYITTRFQDGGLQVSSTDFASHMDFCQGVFRGDIVPNASGTKVVGHFKLSFVARLITGLSTVFILFLLYGAFTEQNVFLLTVALAWIVLFASGAKFVFMPRIRKHREAVAAFISENIETKESGN